MLAAALQLQRRDVVRGWRAAGREWRPAGLSRCEVEVRNRWGIREQCVLKVFEGGRTQFRKNLVLESV